LIKSLAGNEDELPTETHDDGGQHNSEEPPETSCQVNQGNAMYRFDQDPRFITLTSHANYVHSYTPFYINRVARHVAAATPFTVYDMLLFQPVR